MQKTLAEIAKLVDGELKGNGRVVISGLSGIKEAKEGDLTFLANPKYLPLLNKTKAAAVIVGKDVDSSDKDVIVVNNPSQAFAELVNLLYKRDVPELKGIHPSAIIAKDAFLGKDVAVGPLVVIESKVKIDDGSVIHAGSFIGYESSIGKKVYIYPNVTISHHSVIGSNVIIHSGTVIGSDGFGYEFIDGVHQKIPQLGHVEIADQVEIGANVTIDRARFDKTYIGKGTKIDNLVQIAHNVIIEENCIIISQVGISGSTKVEKNAILAGQVGLAGHLTIGAGAVIAAKSGVNKSVPPGVVMFGYPAQPMKEAQHTLATVQRLPKYIELILKLNKRVEELEEKIKNS